MYQSELADDVIIAAAKTLEMHFARVDLSDAADKSALLDALAKSLRFADYFGKNWDALTDCVTDLSWINARGWVVILANCEGFAENNFEDFETMLELLKEAPEYWRAQKTPFWLFVKSQPDSQIELPKITNG